MLNLNAARRLQLPLSWWIAVNRDRSPRSQPINRNHRHFRGEAIVDETIAPQCKGRVRYRAGWWPALCEANVAIAPGETVEVIGIRGISLLVRPIVQPRQV